MLWPVFLGSLSGVTKHLSVLPKSSITDHRSSRTKPKASCVKGPVPDTPWCPADSPSSFNPRLHTSQPIQFREIGRLLSHRALLQAVSSVWNIVLTQVSCFSLTGLFTHLSLWLPDLLGLSLLAFLSHRPGITLPQGVTRVLVLC